MRVESREIGSGGEGAEFFEEGVSGADRFRGRHVDEREALDVAEAEGFQAENDVGEIGALDLGLGEARAFKVVGFRIQADADTVGDAAGATLALVGGGLGDGLDGEAARAGLGGIAADAGETGVDDETDAGNREGGFGDVGGEDDFPVLRGGEDALLFGVGEAAEERDDLDFRISTLDFRFEEVGEFADVALTGKENEDVAGRAFVDDAIERFDAAVDVVERLRLG